jgi:hypothetical protein
MSKKVTVFATLPKTEISMRGAKTALQLEIKFAGSKQGTLNIGRGSVEWWPDSNKVNAHRKSWSRFIDLLETMPRKRSRKQIART